MSALPILNGKMPQATGYGIDFSCYYNLNVKKKGYLSNNHYLITVLGNGTEKVSGNDVPDNLYAIQDVSFLRRLFYSGKCK
jgi:hypothetical protein